MDQELLSLVFDNIYNGVYITDDKGNTIIVNKTFEDMSGIKKEEIVGKNIKDLVNNGYFSASASLLVISRRTPATVTYTTKTNKKLLDRGKPIYDNNGKIKYVINTVWDLSEIDYKKSIDVDGQKESVLDQQNFVAYSKVMNEIIELSLRVAKTDSTVLITGESGVGKSLIADIIHRASNRNDKPMIKINCAAIPESLIESELFGYEAGAFTGADRKGKPGLFELANNGTIFLDEISELPYNAQAKLLSVLHDGEFIKLAFL